MAFLLFSSCWKGFKLEPIQTSHEASEIKAGHCEPFPFPWCWHRKHVDRPGWEASWHCPQGPHRTTSWASWPTAVVCPLRATELFPDIPRVFPDLCWSWSINKAADPFSLVVILLVIEIPFFMTLLGLILESVYSLDFIKLLQEVSVQPRGSGEGWSGSLGLADINFSIQNGYTTRSYCIAQGTVFGSLW